MGSAARVRAVWRRGSATVVVSATPPSPSVSLSANPAQIAEGGTSTLSWSATNASACTASAGWSGAKAISGSQTTSALSQSTTFTLACTGAGGTTTRSVSVTVTPATPAPTVVLTATPAAIVQGEASTLGWSTTNATSCVASGDWSGSRTTSGSQSTGALNTVRTYSYALSCSGAGGTTSRTATVVVSALPPPPTITIAATPSQVPQGGTAMLDWSSANATSCSASGGWSGSKPLSGSQVTSALSQTTTFVLSCTGAGGTASRSTTVMVTVPPAVVAYPLKVSVDQRRLLDQNDRAFLVVGEAAWSLFTGITKAEAEAYLEDRRQRGFNAIIVNIVEHYFNGPLNKDGQAPFATNGGVYDFAQPNDAYFAHVDYVLNVARSKGLLVLMTPAYLGYQGGQEGWWPEINTSVNTEAVMENYGRYLGNRYRGFNNIVWVMGGDYYAEATLAKTRAIVRGIQATDQARLFSAHNSRYESGALYYNAEPWFTLNTTYSDCTSTPAHSTADYQRTPMRPFVYFEGYYENENGSTARCLRSQAYWPVLLGSIGSFFGNRPIWLFDPGWQTALDSTGARGMTYYGRLFRSRAWERLVPDAAVLLSGQGAPGPDYAAAARTADGSSVIVYTPIQKTLTVDMAKVGGTTARGWWFDPATGAASRIGTATLPPAAAKLHPAHRPGLGAGARQRRPQPHGARTVTEVTVEAELLPHRPASRKRPGRTAAAGAVCASSASAESLRMPRFVGALFVAALGLSGCGGGGGGDTGGTPAPPPTVPAPTPAPPPAPTLSLTAAPASFAQGGAATLSWDSTDATTCDASGDWSGSRAPDGSESSGTLSAARTYTYSLQCTGAGGTVSAATTVSVTAPPPSTVPPAVVAFPLKVSVDQRRLLDQNDRAFLVVGEAAWSLFTGITKAEAEAYLEDRRQRGFNAIIVNIVEHFFNGPLNVMGRRRLSANGNVYDFAQPNDAYFAHVDYVLNVARSKGLLVLMTPAYLGYQGGQEGWWPEINTASTPKR